MPTPSLARTLKSIQNLVDQQEWYAAHQKYRTSAARLLKSNDPTSIQDAISLLFEGSRLLLERGQTGSGTDLGLMLIRDVLVAKKVPLGTEERNKLLTLITLTGSSGSWRKTMIDAAISWSCDAGECPTGDPTLHLSIGERLYKENQFQSAVVHLLSAANRDAARVLSNLLWTWSKEDKSNKDGTLSGRYAAIGVLGYLELGSIISARSFLEDYLQKVISNYPKLLNSETVSECNNSKIYIFVIPSLNFLQLLILTCQVGPGSLPNGTIPPANHNGPTIGKAVYQAMAGRYSRFDGWISTPAIQESLATLAEMYFGIRQQRQGGNILSDLMGSLFSGGGGGGGPGGPSSLPPSSRTTRSIEPSGGISAPTLD
ncbi:hypothetical protein PSTG_09636 [Puccinia striiformis f. sp. tritici PST-78]|uniref:Cytoplasmic protein n=1 Tax=Puccinia striiformis f. sp. tritici PST-78 TaxID=1165861 RepID=A0A0L0VCQ2_9BASI|nr:hypothetical protein PSTG_09636 [Puccinia striiformis f. sp. tritici PST-78]